MTEEKNEEIKKVPETAAQDAAQPVAPAAVDQNAQAAAPVKEEKPNVAPAVKQEKPANCAGCKKSIKNKRWYYRNGKYYCTKRCWGTTDKKSNKPQETPAS